MAFATWKAIDVPAEALGAAVLASAAGKWVQFAADLPEDAEFVQMVPLPGAELDIVRLFFSHPSFPEADSAESVPAEEAEVNVAEEAP